MKFYISEIEDSLAKGEKRKANALTREAIVHYAARIGKALKYHPYCDAPIICALLRNAADMIEDGREDTEYIRKLSRGLEDDLSFNSPFKVDRQLGRMRHGKRQRFSR